MLARFVTYEHRDNDFEPAAMAEEQANTPEGAAILDEADAYVWQFAESLEQALEQHNDKHDEWSADMQAARLGKTTY